MSSPLQDRHLLIVEDDAYNIAMMSTLLRRAGAKVFFERWGDELVSRVSTLPPIHLIILDLDYPQTDRDQIFSQLRSIPDLSHTPIVVVAPVQSNVDHFRQLGAKGYITKPINSQKFNLALTRILDGGEVWE